METMGRDWGTKEKALDPEGIPALLGVRGSPQCTSVWRERSENRWIAAWQCVIQAR